MKKKKGFWKKSVSILLCTVLLTGIIPFASSASAQAAERTLLLSQAKAIALANSDSYRRIKSKISLKEVSYKQAVKSAQLKIKNKQTFRWSPLLSFKFPEKLNFEDESDMVYKPAQIQSAISGLKHDLTDEVHRVYESTSQAFLKAYTYQEKVAFEEQRLQEMQNTLDKNKGRVLLGLATQSDVDAMEKNLQAGKEKLAQDMKSFETAKKKLGDLLQLDVSTRYRFMNPYVDAEIPRTALEDLVAYTLENDQAYYEAKMASQLSLLQLNTNYNLMQQQYGSKMNIISPYVQQAKNGEQVNSDAFKASYDKFLENIDAPWQGKKKILFIKIPKEWFKGSIDGVRYIEDEPYALYENALEYQDALADQKAMAVELEEQVRDSYESMVTARGAYLKLKVQVEESKTQLQKEQALNQLGELTFEEYTETQKQYEDQQIEALEALELYSSLLFQLDQLCCGAVSQYLKENEVSLNSAAGGSSYVLEEDEEEGAKYFIQSIVEDNMFAFGVYIPESFETNITHFELWCDDYVIGEKTEIGKTLRHLTLSLTGKERLFVRLYNGTQFVEDCEIEPNTFQGPLKIKNYKVQEAEKQTIRTIGNYESRKMDKRDTVEITLTIDGAEDIHYYTLQNEEGKFLLKEEQTPITEPFAYLDFLSGDMDHLKLQCYDSGKNQKYEAYFNTTEHSIYVIE